MQRSHVTRDVLDVIESCLGDLCRDYRVFRSRGLPPAECNSITASWVDAEVMPGFDDCKMMGACSDLWQKAAGLRIALTRVCIGPDQKPIFDIDLEDKEAACFDDHLDLIEECLLCHDWTTFRRDHGIDSMQMVATTHDVESDGGAFSAYIEIAIVASECCTPAIVVP